MPKKILADVRPANRKKIKRRYRLLIGTHVQKELLIVDGKPVPDVDADGKQLLDENGAPAFRKVSVLYKATPSERPTFETEIDGDQNCLVKRFGADKYQRLDDDGPQGRQRIWDPEMRSSEALRNDPRGDLGCRKNRRRYDAVLAGTNASAKRA